MNIYSPVFLWTRRTFYVNKGLIALGMERVRRFMRKGRSLKRFLLSWDPARLWQRMKGGRSVGSHGIGAPGEVCSPWRSGLEILRSSTGWRPSLSPSPPPPPPSPAPWNWDPSTLHSKTAEPGGGILAQHRSPEYHLEKWRLNYNELSCLDLIRKV